MVVISRSSRPCGRRSAEAVLEERGVHLLRELVHHERLGQGDVHSWSDAARIIVGLATSRRPTLQRGLGLGVERLEGVLEVAVALLRVAASVTAGGAPAHQVRLHHF